MTTAEAQNILSSALYVNSDIYDSVKDYDEAASYLLDWLDKDEPDHSDLEYLLSVCLDGDLDPWTCGFCNERKYRFLGADCPPGLRDEWPVTFEPVGFGGEACEDCVAGAERLLRGVFPNALHEVSQEGAVGGCRT